MNKEIKVSIIVPVYQVEKYIEKCLNSLINQTYKNIEIILIDDGSQDRSGEICDEFANRDSRIRVFHKKNEGVSVARNIGIENSNGEYITFVDSDDYVDRNYVEELINSCVNNDSDISFCGVQNENENGEISTITRQIEKKLHGNAMLKEMFDEKYFVSVCWAKLYKKSVIGNIRFDSNMRIAEDLKFLYEISKNVNNSYINTLQPMYHFLQRENSATKVLFNEDWKKEIDLCEKIILDTREDRDLRKYIIKRYFKVCINCLIIELKVRNDINTVKYLMNKMKKFKKDIISNEHIEKKLKVFFLICLINPKILRSIFKLKNGGKNEKN